LEGVEVGECKERGEMKKKRNGIRMEPMERVKGKLVHVITLAHKKFIYSKENWIS